MESYTLFCCYWQFGISIFHASNNNDEISNYNDFDISRSVLDDLVVNFDVLTNEFQAPVGELTNDRQVNTEPEVDDHENSNTDDYLISTKTLDASVGNIDVSTLDQWLLCTIWREQ